MAKIFTKKFVLIALTAVIALSGVLWIVLANIAGRFNSGITYVPNSYTVSGQGTGAVMTDDYLYFVQGYTATADIKVGDNDYYHNQTMPTGGIYRLHIKDGVPELNYDYNNKYTDEATGEEKEYTADDEENYNKAGNESAVMDWDKDNDWWDEAENQGKKPMIDSVVPKIAGHDTTAMWIFGNTLIYTTPNNLRGRTGVLLSDQLQFFRVDLDGKNNTLIYTATTTGLTADKFTVWANTPDKPYLLINESNTLKRVAMDGMVTQIAENTTAATFPIIKEYRQNENPIHTLQTQTAGVMGYVYYSKAREEGDNSQGNIMYRYNIANGGDPEVIANNGTPTEGTTFTPTQVTDGKFFFSITPNSITKKEYCVSRNITDKCADLPSKYWGDSATFYPNSFVLIPGNKLQKYTIAPNGQMTEVTSGYTVIDGATSVMAATADKVYVQTATGLSVYNSKTGSSMLIGAGTSASGKLEKMPLSLVLPAYSNGGVQATAARLLFVMTETAINLVAESGGTTYKIKI